MNTTMLLTPRTARRLRSLGLGCGLLGLLAGCSSEPTSHVVSAPPPAPPPTVTATTTTTPVVVTTPSADGTTTTTTTTVPSQAIVVTQAPPTALSEPALPRPSAQHVWIPGYYTWRDNRYLWIAGRWELPPRSDATWVPPRWERESGGYRFYEGYWR
jgi:hypothetical protein